MSEREASLDPADVEAIVRTYLGRMARRYSPLIGALIVLLLLATLIPSRSPVATVAGGDGSSPSALGGAPDTSATTPSAPDGGSTPGGSATTPASVGGTAGGAITPPAVAGSRGTARSGVQCGPGVRQVRWTVYAPLCVPRYSGYNGGARTRGVTKDKIIAFYRHARSASDTAINAALASANLNDDQYIADLNTYIGFFNKQFELYGRHVELYVYDGQGDYLQEDQGLDQGQAQADAQTAADHNGFVDATFPLKGSYPFWQALADRKLLSLGPTGFPQSWYAERAPYWYSVLPTGTGVASWLSNLTCARMGKMKANFAGDAIYQVKNRVFGLVTPDNPEYKAIGGLLESEMTKCGIKPASRITYTFNVATMGNQSTSVIAQLKAAQVSTALCYCDPVFPIFMTNAANSQSYHPEWWSPDWGDPQAQQLPQNQWSHAIVVGGKYPAKKDNEAYRVFKLAKPNSEPAGLYYALSYSVVLMLFDALQSAGPNLNAQTFQRGWFALGNIKGPAGTLSWGPGHYSPVIEAPAAWWNQSGTSNFNGATGTYDNCEAGRFLPFDLSKRQAWGSGQIHCFGK